MLDKWDSDGIPPVRVGRIYASGVYPATLGGAAGFYPGTSFLRRAMNQESVQAYSSQVVWFAFLQTGGLTPANGVARERGGDPAPLLRRPLACQFSLRLAQRLDELHSRSLFLAVHFFKPFEVGAGNE